MNDGTAPGRPRPAEHDEHEHDPGRPAASSRAGSVGPWWRVAVAAAAVGTLTWGMTSSGTTLSLGGGSDPADSTGAAPAASGPVSSAVLACPGALPVPTGDPGEQAAVRVLAAVAPAPVLDAGQPDAQSGTATEAPVDDAVATGGPDDAGSTAVPPTTTARPGSGSTLGVLGPDGPSVELRPGPPASLPAPPPGGVAVRADGSSAPGVAGGQLALATGAGARGLSLAACVAPAETHWLLGGGAAPGQAEQVVLTNPGTDAVTVEVSVVGSDGPVPATGAGGIVVPGGGQVVELLDALAPAADAAVVSVTATGGPVVAHLVETHREGTTDRGSEVVGPVAAPATDLVVPALPVLPEGLDGRVVLRLAAPGGAPAVVDVTALTSEGAVRLADLVTRVPAGSTVEVALDELPEGATALRLRSDEPVTGGARLELTPSEEDPEVVPTDVDDEAGSTAGADDDAATAGPDDAAATGGADEEDQDEQDEQDEPLLRAAGDLAWVGATTPSAAPLGLALPDRADVPGGRAWLTVTSVDATTARVTWLDDEGAVTARSLDLPNDTTTLLEAPPEARAVWVVGAGAAGVVSSAHVAGGDGRGPYVAATTLPPTPWLEQVTRVLPTIP